MSIDLEYIVQAFEYAGIFFLMIANGFISFPSSQILYILCGYFASTGSINLLFVALWGSIGNTVGNIILYELARRRGFRYITSFSIFPEREVRKVEIAFRKRGAIFLFLGKLIPALKVFIPIPAGLSKMNRGLFTILTAISSFIWARIFLAMGYFFGKSEDFFGNYAIILSVIALVVIGVFYKFMNSKEVVKELSE